MSSGALPDPGRIWRGTWRIARRICGQDARFAGMAVIDGNGAILQYREDGMLRTPHHTGPAFAEYLYEPRDGALRIRFPDGRMFIDLVFTDGRAAARHVCGPDVYDAQARLHGPGHWCMAYAVRGPRKDYTVFSVMRRVQDYET